MPRVEVAIGVRGAIVKDKLVVGWAVGRLPRVEIIGASLNILLPVLGRGSRST